MKSMANNLCQKRKIDDEWAKMVEKWVVSATPLLTLQLGQTYDGPKHSLSPTPSLGLVGGVYAHMVIVYCRACMGKLRALALRAFRLVLSFELIIGPGPEELDNLTILCLT